MPIQRVTTSTVKVLDELIKASEPVWGLELVRRTRLKTGTVYPILDRLEDAAWLESDWENDKSRSGPRRRLYTLTNLGLKGAKEILKTQASTKEIKLKGESHVSKPLEA